MRVYDPSQLNDLNLLSEIYEYVMDHDVVHFQTINEKHIVAQEERDLIRETLVEELTIRALEKGYTVLLLGENNV